MKKALLLTLILFFILPATGLSAATVQKDTIFNGLYAWLPLDGDATDIGYNRFAAEAKGPVPAADRLGRAGGALHFDGKDDVINLSMDINSSEMGWLTLAMWCRPEQPTGVLFGHDNGYWDRGFGLLNQDRYRGLYVNGGTDGQWFGGIKLPLNQWHLVIVTYDAVRGTASVHTKTDKIHSVTAKAANPGAGWHFTQIGKSQTFDAPFKGSLDNVVVWNRILGHKEVERLLDHPEILDNSPMLAMLQEQNEIKNLFEVGFFEAGAKRYGQALARAGTTALWMNNTDIMLDIMKGAPLKLQGEVFLSHCRSLLALKKKTKTAFHKLNSPQGVRVTRNSGGLYRNDIITRINGRPVKTIADMDEVLKGISPGETVTLTVLRAGAVQQVPHRTVAGHEDHMATQYAIHRLMDYGALAAYTGHPALTRAAAMEISAVQNQFPMDLIPSFAGQAAAILNALATAMEQGPDAAYQMILDCGKLNVSHQRHIINIPQYVAPLFATPKKIAYLLGKEVSTLPKVGPFPVQRQAFLALDGREVLPGAGSPAPDKSGNAPSPKERIPQATRAVPLKEDDLFDGLYAWFPLDGDAEDIGPNRIRTQLKGPVPAEDRMAKDGRALFFDGKDDFIKLFMDINPSKMPRLSVAFWVMPEREWGVLFCHDNGNWDRSVTIENLKEIKGLTSLAGPRVKWFGGVELPQNRWHLVLATWNAEAGTARLYTQGREFKVSKARPGEGWPYTLLGKSPSFSGEFLGRMDNVVVWDRELSDAEAKRLMAHPDLIDNAPRLAVTREMDEAKKLFRAGFFRAGVERYTTALAWAGTIPTGRIGFPQIMEDTKGAPLDIQGEVLISHYRSMSAMKKMWRPDFIGVDDPKGFRVTQTFPAEGSRIRPGDIVTRIDGRQVRTHEDVQKIVRSTEAPPPGTGIPITLIREGTVLTVTSMAVAGHSDPRATVRSVARLTEYGMLAAYAGHPALARAAAQEIIAVHQQFPMDVRADIYKETAALLNALATAMEQGPDAAYRILLDCGKLGPATRGAITGYSQYFAPLYANPKKLAYLLDIPESKLPKPKPFPQGKQPFVTLDGKRIGPGAGIPALEGSGAAPKPAPEAKGTVLD